MTEQEVSWASSPAVRRSMRSNRCRDTYPELVIRRELHRRGHRYFVDRQVLPGLRRRADIVFPRSRVAVFIDGCFWHGCPVHHTIAKTNASFWAEKVRSNRERDADTDERLRAAGWTVIRVWEHEAVDEATRRIETVLHSRALPVDTGDP